MLNRYAGFASKAILIVVVFALVGYIAYKYDKLPNRSQSLNYGFLTPTPSSTPFENITQPKITGWKTYVDKAHGNFSFEYPDFMPEPVIYWPNEAARRFISITTWQIDKMSFGNYEHNIDLRIQGPYPESKGKDLVTWIKEQNWPYQEGETEEMVGVNKITYKNIQGRKLVQSVFTETDGSDPRSWVLYLSTKDGIYRIDLNVQGTLDELSNYQPIFGHILSTFKFLK